MNNDTFAIIATGPSMNQELADYVRGKYRAIAISNAYMLAPWAEAMVSHDRAWWNEHKAAFDFAGEKYSRYVMRNVKSFSPVEMPMGCNSGLMGMYVAKARGAKRLLLLGFDMHGTHYFGKHPDTLKNTTEKRFKEHISQFRHFSGPEVINCTIGSSLKAFPIQDIRSII